MRVMGIDYGDVRIGIAFSDILGIIANGYETYIRKDPETDIKYISSLIKEKDVNTIVIGLPLNMDGTSGKRVDVTKDFGNLLKNYTNANIVYLDERLTSVTAERMLIEADVRREKRKLVTDKIAATIILQNYLDKKK